MPPMAKLKMRLSMSKPVRCANSNRLGGFQYSGTKMGSVRPNTAVTRLTRHITGRNRGLVTYSASQGRRNPLDHASHT